MTVVLQISDPHFGTEVPDVVDALAALAAEIRPDLLVLSGDLTQRARAHQFAAARAFVDRLAIPARVAIPGNHDVPLWNVFARAFSPYAGYRQAFGDVLEPTFESDDLLVVGVKTTRRRRRVDGEVSPEQIERVASRFASASAAKLRIAVIHQPVAIVDTADRKNLLHGSEAAVPRWASAGCDLVLGGHIHLPYLVPLSLRYAPLPREMWALQAGTAVSSRLRSDAPNSVNVLRIGAAADAVEAETAARATAPAAAVTGAASKATRRVVVERWDCPLGGGGGGAGGPAFRRVESTALAFGGDAG